MLGYERLKGCRWCLLVALATLPLDAWAQSAQADSAQADPAQADPAQQDSARSNAARPSTAPGQRSLRVKLQVQGDGSCIDAARLRTQINARLGYGPFFESDEDLVLTAQVQPGSAGQAWEAQLTMVTPDGTALGERVVSGSDDTCESLEQPLAFVISLVVNSQATIEAVAAAKEEAAAQKESERVPEPALPVRAILQFGVAGRAALGLYPKTAWGGALVVSVPVSQRFAIRSELGGWLPVTQTQEDGAQARFAGVDATLQLCYVITQGKLVQLGACLGASGGATRLAGLQLDVTDKRWRPVADGIGTLRFETGTPRLGVGVGFGGVIPVLRDRVVYERPDGEKGVIFERGSLGGRVDLALTWKIP